MYWSGFWVSAYVWLVGSCNLSQWSFLVSSGEWITATEKRGVWERGGGGGMVQRQGKGRHEGEREKEKWEKGRGRGDWWKIESVRGEWPVFLSGLRFFCLLYTMYRRIHCWTNLFTELSAPAKTLLPTIKLIAFVVVKTLQRKHVQVTKKTRNPQAPIPGFRSCSDRSVGANWSGE